MEIKNKVNYIDISELVLMDKNPRKISKENFERLKKSLQNNKEFFEARPIICSNRTGKNIIIAGNQRYRAAKELGMKKVPCVIMTLSEEKEKEINIRDNVELGEWDYDILANEFNEEDLKDWGVNIPILDDTQYTTKIETPIYEPIGIDINLKDCCNTEKAQSYIDEILKLNIKDKELKEFLINSATRLYEFNFKNIAEYYSNLKDKEIKDMFEKLALVIIDYNKAIENGYIECVRQLTNLFYEENKQVFNV